MSREEFDALGAKHKEYEAEWTMSTFEAGKPVVARLDGKAFHTFTKGLQSPHDERLRQAFIETTKYLIHEMHADIGYCQSDEITLAWHNTDPMRPLKHKGRDQKIATLLAAQGSVKFNYEIAKRIPEKWEEMPVMDARVYQYPTQELAAEVFIWREADATRNSLSMAASAHYKQGDLQYVGYAGKHQLLNAKGIEWTDYPVSFKRGIYVRREKVEKMLTEHELSNILPQHRPTGPVLRSVIMEVDMPPVHTLKNRVECLMFGAQPQSDWTGDTPWRLSQSQLEEA